jgi:hypothetical protein
MVKAALEAAGIEFIGAPKEGPGVRLWRKAEQVAEAASSEPP